MRLSVIDLWHVYLKFNGRVADGGAAYRLPSRREVPPMRALSRIGDVLIAIAVIAFTLPLIGCLCVAIKLDSKGPAFAYEPRLGPGGRQFFAIKFRTTHYDPQRGARALWDRAARETRLGPLLHYSRIDELPGIFNVLLGDVRLIGNRRAEVRDLRQIAKWAAWAAAAAVAFETLG